MRTLASTRLAGLYRRYLKHPRLMKKYGVDDPKHAAEVDYWMACWETEGRRFNNAFYERRLLAIAGEPDQSFLAGKVVADFGCGPRGSLRWATSAKRRIGIDVLADVYDRWFDISTDEMEYVRSTEREIPLPDRCIDVIFTMNAMDHTSDFAVMCGELLRILSPGGTLVGSFNLDERPTACEPQTLTPQILHDSLLGALTVVSCRTVPRGPAHDLNLYFSQAPPADADGPRIMWVRATKQRSAVSRQPSARREPHEPVSG